MKESSYLNMKYAVKISNQCKIEEVHRFSSWEEKAIPGKLIFAPILKTWGEIYYILLLIRSFLALKTQSASIVQY